MSDRLTFAADPWERQLYKRNTNILSENLQNTRTTGSLYLEIYKPVLELISKRNVNQMSKYYTIGRTKVCTIKYI